MLPLNCLEILPQSLSGVHIVPFDGTSQLDYSLLDKYGSWKHQRWLVAGGANISTVP